MRSRVFIKPPPYQTQGLAFQREKLLPVNNADGTSGARRASTGIYRSRRLAAGRRDGGRCSAPASSLHRVGATAALQRLLVGREPGENRLANGRHDALAIVDGRAGGGNGLVEGDA